MDPRMDPAIRTFKNRTFKVSLRIRRLTIWAAASLCVHTFTKRRNRVGCLHVHSLRPQRLSPVTPAPLRSRRNAVRDDAYTRRIVEAGLACGQRSRPARDTARPRLHIRYYIDGEADASIDYPIFLSHGQGPA
jgi:hypothetical protein